MTNQHSDGSNSIEELRERAYEILRGKYPNVGADRLRNQLDSLADLSEISQDDLPAIIHEWTIAFSPQLYYKAPKSLWEVVF